MQVKAVLEEMFSHWYVHLNVIMSAHWLCESVFQGFCLETLFNNQILVTPPNATIYNNNKI